MEIEQEQISGEPAVDAGAPVQNVTEAPEPPVREDMVKRHVNEIRDICAEHAVRLQKLRDLPPSRNRDVMIANAQSECSAAILVACDRHRKEANAPAEKESA